MPSKHEVPGSSPGGRAIFKDKNSLYQVLIRTVCAGYLIELMIETSLLSTVER